jgi:putative membrane protein
MAWHTGAGMAWWMLWGGLLWIVVWGTIIYLIITAIRGGTPGRTVANDDTPLEILKRRYARGEINQDDYDRMRRELVA